MRTCARPTVRRRELAERLHQLRGGAQLTEDQVAGRLEWSVSKLIRVEHAHDVRRFPSPQLHSERMASIRRRDATRRIRRFRGTLIGPPRRSRTTPDRRLCARHPQEERVSAKGGTCHLRSKRGLVASPGQHERSSITQNSQSGATETDTFCASACDHAEKMSNLSATSCTENSSEKP